MSTFSPVSRRDKVTFWWNDDDVRFALDKHAISWIFIVVVHWNNSPRIDMSLLSRTHYSGFEPTSHCSYSWIMCVFRRINKYQFYGLWFGPGRASLTITPQIRSNENKTKKSQIKYVYNTKLVHSYCFKCM